MSYPICPNCGRRLSRSDEAANWEQEESDGTFLHADMACSCGANVELAWRGNWDCTTEGDPDILSWAVYGDARERYNNRPTGERTFDLYGYNGSIHNVDYNTVALLIPEADAIRIGETSRVGRLEICRQSNKRPRRVWGIFR